MQIFWLCGCSVVYLHYFVVASAELNMCARIRSDAYQVWVRLRACLRLLLCQCEKLLVPVQVRHYALAYFLFAFLGNHLAIVEVQETFPLEMIVELHC